MSLGSAMALLGSALAPAGDKLGLMASCVGRLMWLEARHGSSWPWPWPGVARH